MKTLANVSNDTSTGEHQGVRHAWAPVSRPVSAFPGGIPLIQRKNLCACDGGCPRCSGVIQPKLTIGAPNDKYEQEADRVADQVMRMPEPAIQRSAGCSSCGELDEDQIQTKSIGDQITPLVQRQEDPEEEEEEEPVQAKPVDNKSPPVSGDLHNQIKSLKGGGQPLSASSRAFFEPRFGRDFSGVRVHKDAEVARAVNAKAFTLGKHLVFNAGQYLPDTSTGKHLLAHELTHTIQQGAVSGRSHLSLSVTPGVIGANVPDIQRHTGDHSGLNEIESYRHTLRDHVHISPSAWERGYNRTSANFLGTPITNGVHRDLEVRLRLAERYLQGLPAYHSVSNAGIAGLIGLRYLKGLRAPTNSTSRDVISFHSFGLAIDVNWEENIYIGLSDNEAEIVGRATRFILGRPINIQMGSGGRSPAQLRDIYQEASDALLAYFQLPGVHHSTDMWLAIRGRPINDRERQRLWRSIERDRRTLMRQNSGWDPAQRGFIDLSEDLVTALTDSSGGGLHWRGQASGGKDLMHFDWRGGRIRDGDRV